MAIWFKDFPISYAQERGRGTAIERLGIELLEAGEDYLKARMPMDAHTRQPAGVLHGGASVVLAETLASWAAMSRTSWSASRASQWRC
jgi:1,4-dihydroxy-2-naphthoyl-CoA hydrolase